MLKIKKIKQQKTVKSSVNSVTFESVDNPPAKSKNLSALKVRKN